MRGAATRLRDRPWHDPLEVFDFGLDLAGRFEADDDGDAGTSDRHAAPARNAA